MSGASDNRLLAGPVLAFVGGAVILLYGADEWTQGVHGPTWLIDYGQAGVLLGLLILVAALGVGLAPRARTVVGGILILLAVFSLVSFGGGNGVGFLLVVLGGTACIAYGPERPGSGLAPAERRTSDGARPEESGAKPGYFYTCPNCTSNVPADTAVCPNCGAGMGPTPAAEPSDPPRSLG